MDEQVINTISQTISKIRAQHNNVHGSQEQQWMEKHVTDPQLKEIVPKLSIVAFHILSAIEDDEQTGIQIAKELNVTRGGITRAAKKLIQYDLVRTNQHPDDKKKIYYSLTESGRSLALLHDQLHQTIQSTLVNQLTAKYSQDELQTVSQFLTDLYRLEGEL